MCALGTRAQDNALSSSLARSTERRGHSHSGGAGDRPRKLFWAATLPCALPRSCRSPFVMDSTTPARSAHDLHAQDETRQSWHVKAESSDFGGLDKDCSSCMAKPQREQMCWSCGAHGHDIRDMFCHNCNSILPPANCSFFDVLGLSVRFDLDAQEMESNYKKLMRQLHPDKYMQHCPQQRELSSVCLLPIGLLGLHFQQICTGLLKTLHTT